MNLRYETNKLSAGYKYIIGCDEVGRGCLAGPVVAAAVVLTLEPKGLKEVRDSKLLSADKRTELEPVIKENAVAWSIAEVSSNEIDVINIHYASLLAMRRAVDKLILTIPSAPEESLSNARVKGSLHSAALGRDDTLFLFVDGKFKVPALSINQEAIIGGDNKVLSIAAASVIAKVYRDDLMQKFHNEYPAYNLKQHKGYATEQHRKIILEQGLTPIHRLSFCQNLSV
ncbi:MAG TPA: ribonuclease HII [Candidatus Limnocylindria bacterium]|nr:ribonuclease HII [Candidatus Limnocylindria bacterium]